MTIQKVCVIGGGQMGRQIALNTAIYPYEVTITDTNQEVLESVKTWSEEYLAGRIAKGRMTEEQVAGIISRFHVVATMEEAAKDADLVIEAIVEREDIKKSVFAALCEIVRPDTILASNSSRMPSSLFKDAVTHPERLINLHYFNPALVMKLTEVVRGEHCSEETVQALCEFSKATGKNPVVVRKEIDGFIANRILRALRNEGLFLVENGYCSAEEIDIACENGLGHPMGPFRLLDLTGIDLQADILKREYEKTGVKPLGYDVIIEKYEKGEYGKKTGRGFYDYTKK